MLHLPGPLLVGPQEERTGAWVVDGVLTWQRPRTPRGVETITLPGWVLPGLVDAHCHVGLGPQGAVDRETTLAQAITERDAGALLLRDAGSPADTRWIDDREDLPRLIRAGRHLARPTRYLRGYGREIDPRELVDAVVEEARRGDGWVTLVGDWIDRDLGDLAPCWPADVLVEAVAAAHAAGARVTAHCFGPDCLPDLLAAGIDGIEHATGLDDDTITAAASAGVSIVPTLVNTARFGEFADAGQARFPAYAARMRDLATRRERVVVQAWEAGVPIRCGTDAGGALAHGLVAEEVQALAAAGLPPTAALDAATWGARAWLGAPGLVEGAPADLVVLAADPRQDLRTLRDPRAVVLRGRVHRPRG
ncbi:MAG: amidohydrolase family protein [Kineosporiaceae bacterium]